MSEKISVRFERQEAREIRYSARAAGLSVSDYLRRAIYKSSISTEALAAEVRCEVRAAVVEILRRLDAEAEARAAIAVEQKDSLVKAINYLDSRLAGGKK